MICRAPAKKVVNAGHVPNPYSRYSPNSISGTLFLVTVSLLKETSELASEYITLNPIEIETINKNSEITHQQSA